jgi:hypothetical protein
VNGGEGSSFSRLKSTKTKTHKTITLSKNNKEILSKTLIFKSPLRSNFDTRNEDPDTIFSKPYERFENKLELIEEVSSIVQIKTLIQIFMRILNINRNCES